MKLSFATLGCPAWTLEQIAANAKTMGFDGVELRGIAGEHIGPDETPERRIEIRRLFETAGVEIACIMVYSNFAQDDPQNRAESVAGAARFIAMAHDLGCRRLRLFGGQITPAGRAECARRVVECLKRLAPLAEKAGVSLAVETHDDWCEGESLRGVIEVVQSPAVGVCWDMSNSFFVEPYERTFPAIEAYIKHVHFKDAARVGGGKIVSKLPGTGEVPMHRALKLLKDSGYRDYLSFEWEKKWEPQLADPEVAFPHYLKYVRGLMDNASA